MREIDRHRIDELTQEIDGITWELRTGAYEGYDESVIGRVASYLADLIAERDEIEQAMDTGKELTHE